MTSSDTGSDIVARPVGVDGVRRGAITVNGVVEEVFRDGRVLGCGDPPAA
jgi:hypothetical protein